MGLVRSFDEALIIKYKETNNESFFEEWINSSDIKKYVNYVCQQKLRNSPTNLYSQEDFVNLSYLILWQGIHKYRFICPFCKKQAKTSTAHKLHTLTKHGQYEEPKVSITRYLKFNLGAYLQNEIRREYSIERKSNVMTLSIYSPLDEVGSDDTSSTSNDALEYDFASEESMEDEIVFDEILVLIKKQFDELTKEIFELIYRDRLKQRDVAVILFNRGRYSSEQSAAVVVSRVIKNKINPAVASLYPELFQ
jgi:hypothetical protein